MKKTNEGNKKTRTMARRAVLFIVAALVVVLVTSFFLYAGDYRHATSEAKAALISDETVLVADSKNGITFTPVGGSDVGFIFYPGGKVESESYAPLLRELAQRGVVCVIARMPFRLAMFDVNVAGRIRAEYPGVHKWFVGGHSMGGAFVSLYAKQHEDELGGLVFLASYPATDLSATSLRALSVSASNDGLATPVKIEGNKEKLPHDTQFVRIEGGNHAGFGDYGAQPGDGAATISPEEQKKQTVDALANFVKANR